jgi:hypothetical protein
VPVGAVRLLDRLVPHPLGHVGDWYVTARVLEAKWCRKPYIPIPSTTVSFSKSARTRRRSIGSV